MEDQYDVDENKMDALARLVDTTLLYDMPECETFGPIEGADLMEVIEECQRWRDSHATDKGNPLAYNPDHCAARDALTEQLRYQAKRTDLAQSLADALEEAKSVIASINSGNQHKVELEGDDVGYWQRGEWCEWAKNDVLPKIDAALANYRKGE